MVSPAARAPWVRVAAAALGLPLLGACSLAEDGCVAPEALQAAPAPGSVRIEPGTTMWAGDAALSDDGTRLVVRCDGETCLWDTSTGRLLDPLPPSGEHTAWAGDVLVGTSYDSGEEQGEVRLTDDEGSCTMTGHDIGFATDGGSGVSALDAHPDGDLLATGAVDGRVGLWSVDERERLAWLDVSLPDPSALAWSPGELLAVGGRDAPAEIWSADVDAPERRLSLTDPLTALAWSPDGERLAGVGPDGVQVWDVATWEPSGTLAVDGVTELAWSPDSSRLAVVRPDAGTMEVVDPDSSESRVVARHATPPQSVLWAPDGAAVYSVDGADGVRRTPLDADGRQVGKPERFETPPEIGT